jgi:hypothetical protein
VMVSYESTEMKPLTKHAENTTRALDALFHLAGEDQFIASLIAMLTKHYGQVDIKLRVEPRKAPKK